MKHDPNIKNYLSWRILSHYIKGQRYARERLDDIDIHFGIGGSGVCQAGRRISERIKKDKTLAKIIKKIERNIKTVKNDGLTPFFTKCQFENPEG